MAFLPNKLVAHVAFKAGGDVYHRLFTNNPPHLTKVTPSKFQSCELHEGTFGTNGSVLQWTYTVDGEVQTCKQIIQNVDEEKKQFSYKFIEGDLLELYKDFVVTCHVETRDGVDYITWTIDYELLKADNQHPINILKFVIGFTKDIETHMFG
ncbi:hypothetical protein ABFS83_10G107500 [Erythranthe nasuta]